MSEAVDLLVFRGYGGPDDILGGFTMDQVELFVRVAERRRRRELLDISIAVRVGFGADKRVWKEYVDYLTREPGEGIKPSSKEQMKMLKEWSKKKEK